MCQNEKNYHKPVPALRNLCTRAEDCSGEYPDPAVAAAKAAVAADELDLKQRK